MENWIRFSANWEKFGFSRVQQNGLAGIFCVFRVAGCCGARWTGEGKYERVKFVVFGAMCYLIRRRSTEKPSSSGITTGRSIKEVTVAIAVSFQVKKFSILQRKQAFIS